jgi:hypothetical protein
LPDVEKQVVVVIHHWSSEAETSANSQTLGGKAFTATMSEV